MGAGVAKKYHWGGFAPPSHLAIASNLLNNMKKFYLIFASFSLCFSGISGTNDNFNQFTLINSNYLNRVVSAIYVIEGGANTKWPYGIKSIKTNNPEKICRNTVSHNYLRWQKSGKTNDFLTFLGNRYCPASDDPVGNKNWINNIHKLVK